jgi:hypothetical protein
MQALDDFRGYLQGALVYGKRFAQSRAFPQKKLHTHSLCH